MTPDLSRIHAQLTGRHSGLWGDCSDLRGDCSGLRGDLDACGLTAVERAAGVDIITLVGGAS